MRIGSVTTPFGRRPMTLAIVKRQLASAEISAGKKVDKWKVFRDACAARSHLGIHDRALAVLDALLTFYPHQELAEEQGLIVFPSNAQLSIRAHGITDTTLRRQIAALVEAGLVTRKDSPNGKRYARKDDAGGIADAFGFSLAPLLARAEELALMAQQVLAERRQYQMVKEEVSIYRRDIRKLIAMAVEENTAGEWTEFAARLDHILIALPRSPGITELTLARDALEHLRNNLLNQLETLEKTKNINGNDVQIACHIQNSNTQHINEFEPSSEKEQGVNVEPKRIQRENAQMAFPLAMVLKGCPSIADYGPQGSIRSWRDMMTAGVVVRSMLGVSPSAYQDACEVMGQENAATAIACMLERSTQINSPGGYLRDLTARMRRGEFSLGPMLMALLRVNSDVGRRAS